MVILLLLLSVAALSCTLVLIKIVVDFKTIQTRQRRQLERDRKYVRDVELGIQIELFKLNERIEELEMQLIEGDSRFGMAEVHKSPVNYNWLDGDVYVRFAIGDLLFGETFHQRSGEFHLFNIEGNIAQFEYCGNDERILDSEYLSLRQICEVCGQEKTNGKIKHKRPGLVRAEEAGQWRVIKRAQIEFC